MDVLDTDDVATVTPKPRSLIGSKKLHGWGDTEATRGIYVLAFVATSIDPKHPTETETTLAELSVFENFRQVFSSSATDKPRLTQDQKTVVKSVMGSQQHLAAHL